MFGEKEKRKEKPKRNNRKFIGLSIISILILFAWFFVYANSPCACQALEATEEVWSYSDLDNPRFLTPPPDTATPQAEQGR